MNVEETKHAIEVMQAYVEGKTIEFRERYTNHDWVNFEPDADIVWNWEEWEHRVKPEPREIWVMHTPEGNHAGVSVAPMNVPPGYSQSRFREVLEGEE